MVTGKYFMADELELEHERDGRDEIEGTESVGLIGVEVAGLIAVAVNGSGKSCFGSRA